MTPTVIALGLMALNPIPVALMILWCGIMIVLLWLDTRRLDKRIKKLETPPGNGEVLIDGTIRAQKLEVKSYPAGTDICAGEPVFIAEDGNAYPASLKEQRP